MFEGLDGGLAGDEWKKYARETNKVWYVSGSNLADEIHVDFVTEPGLLQNHHLITRLTENNGNFTFAAQVRLDFDAVDVNGDLIWNPQDIIFDLQDRENRDQALAAGGLSRLLPPEGYFLAIIIDALAGIIAGGPGGPPSIFPKKLLFGTDIVAVDYQGRKLLADNGCATTGRATHIDTVALTYTLGTNNPH